MTTPPRRKTWKVQPFAAVYPAPPGSTTLEGHVQTPHGFVDALICEGPQYPCTILQFIDAGRMHHWRWDRSFSRRYVVTLATRMAASIVKAQKGTQSA